MATFRICLFTGLALIAFAANSVLCRLALGEPSIDAASFSSIRIVSGAIVLWLILSATTRSRPPLTGSWKAAIALCLYAVPFSFAYIGLDAGVGALILFGTVQVTMMSAALGMGERPNIIQWTGLVLAAGGLVYLVMPGLSAPPVFSSALMIAAGVGWGIYTLLGKGGRNPLANTASNFIRAIPLVVAVSLMAISQFQLSLQGALLAVVSGAVTSGIGYAIWYVALRDLTATRAAIVQLSVPILAALGGAVVLSETITGRLVIATVVVLGGVGVGLAGREKTGKLSE